MTIEYPSAAGVASQEGEPGDGDSLLAAVLRWSMVVLAPGIAVLMWAPWLRTGQATRSSFGAFRALQLLGSDQLTPLRVVWWLLPVLLAVVTLIAAMGRTAWAAAGLTVLASIVALAAAGMWVMETGAWGAQLALMGSLAALAVSSLVLARRFLTRS